MLNLLPTKEVDFQINSLRNSEFLTNIWSQLTPPQNVILRIFIEKWTTHQQ